MRLSRSDMRLSRQRSEGTLRLPQILSPPHQRHQATKGKGGWAKYAHFEPQVTAHVRKELLANHTPQINRLNDEVKREMVRRAMQQQNSKAFGKEESTQSQGLAAYNRGARQEAEQVAEFEKRAQELSNEIRDIQRNMERFTPQLFIQQRNGNTGALRRSVSEPNMTQGKGAGDEEDTAQEEMYERILKYRFVRKIEPDLPPLPPLSSIKDEKEEKPEGSIILRNRSPEALQRWHPSQAAMLRAERSAEYMSHGQVVRDRYAQIVQERMQMVEADLAARELSPRARGLNRRKNKGNNKTQERWETTLCMVSFLLICQKLMEKYRLALRQYEKQMQEGEEEQEGDKGKKAICSGWAKMRRASVDMRLMERNSLVDQFIRVARQHGATAAGRRSLLLLDSQRVINQMPTMPQNEKTWQTTMFVQTFVLSRLRVKARRARALFIWECLSAWKTSGTTLVMFKKFTRRVRQIQAFWRWCMQYLGETRKKIAITWVQLERELLTKKLGVARNSELSLSERVDLAMMDEKKRTRWLKGEMRIRRYELLPAIVIWQGDMQKYKQEVDEWKQNREACKLMGGENVPPPTMPGVPSHMPETQEIAQMVHRARANQQPRTVNDIKEGFSKVTEDTASMTLAKQNMLVARSEVDAPIGGPQNLTPPPDNPVQLNHRMQ